MTGENRSDPWAESGCWPYELLVASAHEATGCPVARQFADHVLAVVEGDRMRCVICGHEERLPHLFDGP